MGARPQAHQSDLVVGAGQQHDDLLWPELEDVAHRADAVELRHDDVHEDDVRLVEEGELHRLAAGPGLRDDVDPRVLQRAPYHPSGQGIVIRDDHPERCVRVIPVKSSEASTPFVP